METKYAQYSTTLSILTYHRCHLGQSIVYDTVSNLSWSVDIRTHGIVNVIDNILNKPWPPSAEVGREVPVPQPEVDCVVSLLDSFVSGFSFNVARIATAGNLETFQNRDLPTTMLLLRLAACE